MLGYQVLQDQSQLTRMQRIYDTLLQEKEESKNRAIEDLTKFYESKLQRQAKELNKETMNCVLLKRNQDLVKSNMELEVKLKELQNLIKPRDVTISRMICKISQMESELEMCNKRNTDLELHVKELNRKLTAKDKELNRKLTAKDKELQEEHQKIESAKMKTDMQKDFRRQREILESSVATLRKKLADEAELHRAEKARMLEENSSLVQEIDYLQHEMQIAKTKIYNLEVSIRSSKNKDKVASKSILTSSGAVPDEKNEEKERMMGYMKTKGSVPIVDLQFGPSDNKQNRKTIERNMKSDLKLDSSAPICLPTLKQAAKKYPKTNNMKARRNSMRSSKSEVYQQIISRDQGLLGTQLPKHNHTEKFIG